MSIKKYEVLLQTADLGSFTKASEVLGYTQSAISHIITGLEDELGLKLLARDRFGVRLTAEGEALLPAIRAVCQQNQELLRQAAQFHGLEVGQVRIGTWLSVSVHLLPRLLQTFSQRHPDITFELLQGSSGSLTPGFERLQADAPVFRRLTGVDHSIEPHAFGGSRARELLTVFRASPDAGGIQGTLCRGEAFPRRGRGGFKRIEIRLRHCPPRQEPLSSLPISLGAKPFC